MASNIIGVDPIYQKVFYHAAKEKYNMCHILDSVSQSQIESKRWLVDNLPFMDNPIIQLFGGWLGYPMIDILLESFDAKRIVNLDIDERSIDLCQRFTNYKQLDFVDQKTHNVNDPYRIDDKTDCVINTSSEHMDSLPQLIKNRNFSRHCVFALQSNNMFHIHDHINCVNSVDELVEKSGIQKIHYSGTLEMPNGYKRYMVIGWLST